LQLATTPPKLLFPQEHKILKKKKRKGSPGYVPRGWREAVRAAKQTYYQETDKTPSEATLKRRELGTIPQLFKGHPE